MIRALSFTFFWCQSIEVLVVKISLLFSDFDLFFTAAIHVLVEHRSEPKHQLQEESVAVDVMPRMKSIHLDRKTPIFRAEKCALPHRLTSPFRSHRIHQKLSFDFIFSRSGENISWGKKLHFKLDDWQIIFNFRKDVLTSENCKTAKSWMLDNQSLNFNPKLACNLRILCINSIPTFTLFPTYFSIVD